MIQYIVVNNDDIMLITSETSLLSLNSFDWLVTKPINPFV